MNNWGSSLELCNLDLYSRKVDFLGSTRKFSCRLESGSGCSSLASHRGGPDSRPSQLMLGLWRHCDRVFSKFFGFPLSVSSTVAVRTHISPRRWTIGPFVAALRDKSHAIIMTWHEQFGVILLTLGDCCWLKWHTTSFTVAHCAALC
jgi:hypothetical protein